MLGEHSIYRSTLFPSCHQEDMEGPQDTSLLSERVLQPKGTWYRSILGFILAGITPVEVSNCCSQAATLVHGEQSDCPPLIPCSALVDLSFGFVENILRSPLHPPELSWWEVERGECAAF